MYTISASTGYIGWFKCGPAFVNADVSLQYTISGTSVNPR